MGLAAALMVVAAPLPTGGVPPWAQLAIRLAAFLLLALAIRVPGFARAAVRVRAPTAALGALAALAVAQSLPLPPWLVRWLSPRHAELARIGPDLADLGGPDGWVRLSLSAEMSRSAALTLAAAAALVVVGAVCGSSVRTQRFVLAAIVAGGVVQGAHGVRGLTNGDVLRLRGTFFNPDHCALYLEISLAVATAILWWLIRDRRVVSLDVAVLGIGLGGLLWGSLLLSLVATGSRTAVVAVVAGAAAQAVLIVRWSRGAVRRLWGVAAGLSAVVAALLLVSRASPVLGRLLVFDPADSNVDLRIRIWADSLELLRSFPLTGVGIGSFLEAFSLVQDPSTVGLRWVRAHSDPIELLVSAGLLGAAAAAVGVVGSLRRLRVVARAGGGWRRAMVLAGTGVLVAAGVHELFDFGATLPGNWVALATVTGALLGTPAGRRPRPARDRGRRHDPAAGDGDPARRAP